MEYATREQAQQAVNTLSNQNLMGRLVYVREVSGIANSSKDWTRSSRTLVRSPSSIADFLSLRTAKPNLVSPDRLPPVEATRVDPPEVGIVTRVTAAAAEATEGLQPQVADARSSLITSVIPNLTRLLANLHYFD